MSFSHMHFTTITIASSLRWLRFDIPCSNRSAVVQSVRKCFSFYFRSELLAAACKQNRHCNCYMHYSAYYFSSYLPKGPGGLSADNQGKHRLSVPYCHRAMALGAPTGDSPSRFLSPPHMKGGASDNDDVEHPAVQIRTLPQFGAAAPAVSIASGVKELIDSPGADRLPDFSDIRSQRSSGASSSVASDLKEVRRQNQIEELQKRAAAKKKARRGSQRNCRFVGARGTNRAAAKAGICPQFPP